MSQCQLGVKVEARTLVSVMAHSVIQSALSIAPTIQEYIAIHKSSMVPATSRAHTDTLTFRQSRQSINYDIVIKLQFFLVLVFFNASPAQMKPRRK